MARTGKQAAGKPAAGKPAAQKKLEQELQEMAKKDLQVRQALADKGLTLDDNGEIVPLEADDDDCSGPNDDDQSSSQHCSGRNITYLDKAKSSKMMDAMQTQLAIVNNKKGQINQK